MEFEQRKLEFFNEMNQYLWASLMDIPDVNECFNTISNTIFDMINRNFPCKEVAKKALVVGKPCITRKISTLIREKVSRSKAPYKKPPTTYTRTYKHSKDMTSHIKLNPRATRNFYLIYTTAYN